jgi:flagellar basal-body rod protein FlgB
MSVLNLLKNRIRYTEQYDKVLSSNISKLNIPGAIARDLKPFSVLLKGMMGGSSCGRLTMMVTSPYHIAGNYSGNDIGSIRSEIDKTAKEKTINGNNIDIAVQMKKKSDNQIAFNEASLLYKKMSAMLRIALGG